MKRRGFLLVEASLAGAVLALAAVALVPFWFTGIKAAAAGESSRHCAWLAAALLEEISLRRWDEQTPTPPQSISAGSASLGSDASETASDKTTFDDIDDFNGWTESPPRDPLMQSLSAFTGYTSSVTVSYVDSSLAASASATDYKRVSVCTRWRQNASVCVNSLRTNR